MLKLQADAGWRAPERFVTIWGFRKPILGEPTWSLVMAYGDGAVCNTA